MKTLAEVTTFINDCVKKLGAGFHPDTPFEDYWTEVDAGYAHSTFTYAEAEELNQKMSDAMDYCADYGHDIYEIAVVALSNTDWFDLVK